MKLIKYALNIYVIFVVMMLLLVYPYIIPDILGLPEETVMDVIFAGLAGDPIKRRIRFVEP